MRFKPCYECDRKDGNQSCPRVFLRIPRLFTYQVMQNHGEILSWYRNTWHRFISFYHWFSERIGTLSGFSTAPFIGGFSVLEMGMDLLPLNLTPVSHMSIITVVGNTGQSVKSGKFQRRNHHHTPSYLGPPSSLNLLLILQSAGFCAASDATWVLILLVY
ncbi:hypothetical protein C5167_040113 [Papaver somniferum]|uniref:Uncharacterized protein n=1 Tax=Papaver somniferum TaxID=3469 RepID=A0A4Y7II89_PAPSO|nr:hypothetical protein C5167_040113 [Papaver somniferum]